MHVARSVLVSAVLSLACIPGFAAGQEQPYTGLTTPTITVEGDGRVGVSPEIATITGKIVTSGQTVAEARDPHPALVTKARAVIDSLAAQGLQLRTAQYQLSDYSPTYYRDPDSEAPKYFATTNFVLVTENLTTLDAVVTALATTDLQLDKIDFRVRNPRAPYLEARKVAAEDARDQAQAYADALGVELGPVRRVIDSSTTVYSSGEAADLITLPEPQTLSVQAPASLNFSASVTIVWDIAQAQP